MMSHTLAIEVEAAEEYRAAKLRLLNFLSLFRDRDLQKPTRFSGGGVVA